MKFTNFFLIAICFRLKASAHSDFWQVRTIKNVKVRLTTGFQYEEINKAWIIGELASRLSKKLGYRDTIFIDYDHVYIERIPADYFLSCDKKNLIDADRKYKEVGDLKKEAIVIFSVAHSFDPIATLNLLEYAIINRIRIKGLLHPINYKRNRVTMRSVDTSITRKIANKAPSLIVSEILASRVYRSATESERYTPVSYFFQNNKYHIYSTRSEGEDTVLISVSNVYQFERYSSFANTIIFDSDSSFFYIDRLRDSAYISGKHIISDKGDFYKPYQISWLSDKIIGFSFGYWVPGERRYKSKVALYIAKRNSFIQDLESAF